MKLNLGCGNDIRKNYINIDNIKFPGVDLVYDLENYPYPFKDNTFDGVLASHVLEHLKSPQKALYELCRISKNGSKILIRVPHFSSCTAYWNPDHKNFWSYFSFNELRGPCVLLKRRLNFTRFSWTFLNYIINPLINMSPAIYERFFCWMFPCSEVLFELKVNK